MPYEYIILHEIKGTPIQVYNLERQLHKMNQSNKYEPLIKFNGYTECFESIKDTDLLK